MRSGTSVWSLITLGWIWTSPRTLWDVSYPSGGLRILADEAWIWQSSGFRNSLYSNYLESLMWVFSLLRLFNILILSKPNKLNLVSLRRWETSRKRLLSRILETPTAFTAKPQTYFSTKAQDLICLSPSHQIRPQLGHLAGLQDPVTPNFL